MVSPSPGKPLLLKFPNVAAPEALAQVLVQGLELLVVTGISVAPPNDALRKILSEKSPIVASMTEKPQILGLCMCLKKKKTTSHLLLTVFIVLLFIYCMFFFFLHIGVNLPDSVKNILWLGILPLSKCATCGHCRECEKNNTAQKKRNYQKPH